jgi:hypothetical protein
VVDAYEESDDYPDAALGRKVIGAFYRTGGRVARHTGWAQRLLWRATLALFIGNLMLAGILYVDRGEVPGIYAGGAKLEDGATARATTDGLRIRSEPGREAGVVGLLALDQEVRITGRSEAFEDEIWWPVRATVDGASVNGYVAGGWLEPTGGPGDVWLNRAIDEVKSLPGKALDRMGITK